MTWKNGWRAGLLLLLAMVIILAGCGQPKPEPEPEPKREPIIEEEDTPEPEPEVIYPYTYPLTGSGTYEQLEDRPILVLVENHRDARPQSGLIHADIVYEILAEGEITRFAAVFHSEQPEVIGPIRSLRPYYAEIGAGWDAMIVHAGYSPAAKKMVQERRLDHFDEIYGDGAYYWRSKERYAPHNLYSSVELIRKGQTNKGMRTEWKQPAAIPFADKDVEIQGEQADYVRVEYLLGYHVEYKYDEENEIYLRHMLGEPHVDKETEEQITASNILVIETSHRVLDDVGRRDVNVFGPGSGWLIQKGVAREIDWERVDGIIRPYIDGEEVPLIPGKTWVQVISPGLEVTFDEDEEEEQ